MDVSRRKFLAETAVSAMSAVGPNAWGPLTWPDASFFAGAAGLGRKAPNVEVTSNKTVVVVELSGGNDGLNAVVPYASGDYYKYRPNLAIQKEEVQQLDGEIGLHPSLSKLKSLYSNRNLALLQGVGYPQPNRSHFRSMEIWYTAVPERYVPYGWLGKYFDKLRPQTNDPMIGVNIGSQIPQALLGQTTTVPSFESLETYGWLPNRADPARTSLQVDAANEIYSQQCLTCAEYAQYMEFLRKSGLDAFVTSEALRAAAQDYSTSVEYPQNAFADKLKLAAQIIAGNKSTRVLYVSISGFDTHANQPAQHANLLQTVSDGIDALYRDLQEHGRANDTLIMTFSEFGRRVVENASRGTDHGAAAPLFVVGGKVSGDVYGDHPSLQDLEDGDLRYKFDFRSVYATILDDWLGIDHQEILGAKFEKLPIIQ